MSAIKKPTTYKKNMTNKKTTNDNKQIDPIELGNIMAETMKKSQEILSSRLSTENIDELKQANLDPFNLNQAVFDFWAHIMNDPERMVKIQADFWSQWASLYEESAKKFLGQDCEELHKPEKRDRRWKDESWEESALFDFIKQSYLMTSRWMQKTVHDTEGMSSVDKTKLDFFTKQFTDAMSPSNFIMTNPEVLKETMESGGENLIKGLENLLHDIEKGRVTTASYDNFEVGKNLATTKGQVIFQNDLIQLIQYEPSTKKVFKTPLLIIPPWFNKFYILDMREDNSYIKWAVDQGQTVFVISWVNPDEKLSKKQFEDYMIEGSLAAIDVVKDITKEKEINVTGYCLGGTLLATTLAYLAKNGKDKQIKSATFLTTLLDFEKSGELKMFTDDDHLELLEKKMDKQGYLSADYIRGTFSMLRSNDLIWSFVVNNYLLGKEPFPFDLLYWNDDSTNMQINMHKFCLKRLYRDNALSKANEIKVLGTGIDLGEIKTPSYFLSTREDHITPWKATFAGPNLLKNADTTYTLAASGHIAGIVNPPKANKYCYWTSSKKSDDPEKWLEECEEHKGSWWGHWHSWLSKYGGEKVLPRKIGNKKYQPIEDAPGSYVKKKA